MSEFGKSKFNKIRWQFLFGLLVFLFGSGFQRSAFEISGPTFVPPSSLSRVRVILFWTPDCDYCRQVVEKELPPLISRFGQQLQMLYLDINHPNGEMIYQEAVDQYGLADPQLPIAVIGQTILQGPDISQKLPELVADWLREGGVDWPNIIGLERWLETLPAVMSLPLDEAQCTECELMAISQPPVMSLQSPPLPQATAESPKTIARAVMFWMEGCPHCHDVLENVLPPIQAKYGDQFQILLIELVGGDEVLALYALAESMGIAKEEVGVPFLIIGEYALIGSGQIPAELPGLIERYLASGGVDFPQNPVLVPFLANASEGDTDCSPSAPCTETPQVPSNQVTLQPQATVETSPATPSVPVRADGFTLAVVVLVGMVAALIYSGLQFLRSYQNPKTSSIPPWMDWGIPILSLIGLAVAGYLAYVETQAATAFCGPVGDCNAVQSSPYAKLFGVLPVGVLGVVGYLAILAAWFLKRRLDGRRAAFAALALFGMTFGGVLFSVYLTYLEPFVIRAVCIWCVSSAVIMTLLLLLSLPLVGSALNLIKRKGLRF